MKTQANVNMAKPTVDFVCPTFDNPQILHNFVHSFTRNTFEPWRLIIVNNGAPGSIAFAGKQHPGIHLIEAGSNLGWMGGVNLGVKWCMENNPAKYIGFINDDVQIIDHDLGWLTKMVLAFQKPDVGAVGPTSNKIMGMQSFHQIGLPSYVESMRLSGMCMIVKREAIEKIGLLDESLPGGDDLDYSMRLRDAGYRLAICRRTFLFHHYATTGKRVNPGWDSREHTEEINKALIHKHGFKKWYVTVNDLFPPMEEKHDYIASEWRYALDELSFLCETGKVLDLGCGGQKFHPKAIGVDIRPEGVMGVGYNAFIGSAGEVNCDVANLSPFDDGHVDGILAKHLLEHMIDPVKAIREWGRVLKDNGKLVIIVPDWRYCEAISCDPSHTAAYTPESLKSLIGAIGGFKINNVFEVSPGYVFGISCEKVPARVAVEA